MLGYVTPQAALAAGCTHHGRYYGLPIWIGDLDDEAPLVMAKVAWLDWALDVIVHIEGALRDLFRPDDEPGFLFQVGAPIAGDNRREASG